MTVPALRSLDWLTTERDRLERDGSWSSWNVPQVRLDADRLHWKLGPTKKARPGEGLLEGFLVLSDDRSGDRIARFARRWGVLAICEHGLPYTHNAPYWDDEWDTQHVGDDFCLPLGIEHIDEGGEAWEPLSAWRRLAETLQALLAIAVALQQDERPTRAGWQKIRAGWERIDAGGIFGVRLQIGGADPPWYGNLRTATRRVYELLNELLVIADVRPHAVFGGRGPAVKLGSSRPFGGLFAALAVQTLMAACRSEGLYVCHGCGRPFALGPTERRRQAGRNTYCPDCGLRAARRDASERWRQKHLPRKRG